MRKKSKAFVYVYLTFFTAILLSRPVSAYIDPATTSYIIQIVAAAFITLGVVFSALTTKSKLFFIKIKMKLMEEYYSRKARGEKASEQSMSDSPSTSRWFDNRSFKGRMMISSVSAFAIAFTFIIFGSYDLFIANKDIFPFTFNEIWLYILMVGLICFAVMTVILSLFRGKVYNWVISLAVGILLAGYIQGNFLNLNLGQLTGDAVAWDRYKVYMLLNCLAWILIIAVPFIIGYASRIIWRGFCFVLPSLLVVIQTISLIVALVGIGASGNTSPDLYLSTRGIYEVSSKDNIIVIVLDRLDEDYIRQILEDDPNYFDDLDGFTRYTNNLSYYCRSYPSVVNMLTGAVSFYDIPADDFVSKAYAESRFLPDLRAHNYTTKLYMEKNFTYTKTEQLAGIADNIFNGKTLVNAGTVTKKLLNLSAYRYVPHSMKPSFWMSTASFMNMTEAVEKTPAYVTDDLLFYENLKSKGLSVQNQKNNFVYYHLNGSHAPYNINERVERVSPKQTSVKQQTMGCFNIVREFFRQLKEKGLYNDANIIITGDHGKSEDIKPLNRPVLTGLFVKPKGSYGTPLKTSRAPVNTDNLRGTIIKMAGIKSDEYPPAYWEVPENADVVRKYYYRVNGKPNKDNGYLEEFEIRGDASDFSNWHKLREIKIKYPHA
ncbi:MAG: sulfatase-like hydrolase/transferase [Clostridiales bacterium]|jgi:hypothetical protein|nr:sulfatase-like hydrolase/transferase [Clostridiales bacterium]